MSLGLFVSLLALQAAHPTGTPGQYAIISVVGGKDKLYLWDADAVDWVPGGDGTVFSVFGRYGDISPSATDYTPAFIGAEVAGARAAHELAYAHSELHSHTNKTELDKVSDGDHDVRSDNPHGVTSAQASFSNTASGLTGATAQAAIDEIWNKSIFYSNSIMIDPLKPVYAGHSYQTIKEAADYINATAGAPLIILVPNGTYNIEETIIFKKAVQVIGQSKENTIFNFTYNAANKWVQLGASYPYYGRACFYWGDIADQGTYYTRVLLRMKSPAGIQNATIITKSRALSHIMGYVQDEAGSPVFKHLILRTEKEPVAVFGFSRSNIFAVDWFSPNTSTTIIGGMPQYAVVEDVELNPFKQLTGTVSAIGTNAITGNGTLFLSELYVGAYISKGGNQYKIASVLSDTSATIDRNLTCTDNEFLAYMPFDCGIKMNCFDHPFDSTVHLILRDVNMIGVLSQSIYISGFANADIRNVLLNGCSWDNVGQAAGASSAIETAYTDYVNIDGLRAYHYYTNGYEYAGGLWNLIYAPQGVVSADNIQAPGTPAKTITWYDGIKCQGGSSLLNIIFGSYTIAHYTVSIPTGQSNVFISNMRDTSSAAYSIYFADAVTNFVVSNSICDRAIYAIGSGKISNSRFGMICYLEARTTPIQCSNTEFTNQLTLSTTCTSTVDLIGGTIGILNEIASNAYLNMNGTKISQCKKIVMAFGVISNCRIGSTADITGYVFELANYQCRMINNHISLQGTITDAIVYMNDRASFIGNFFDTKYFPKAVKQVIKAVSRNQISKNIIKSLADAGSTCAIETTGDRNIIEGNIIAYSANPNPVPAILIAGTNNVVNGNIAESFATVVSDTGTNTQLALNVA